MKYTREPVLAVLKCLINEFFTQAVIFFFSKFFSSFFCVILYFIALFFFLRTGPTLGPDGLWAQNSCPGAQAWAQWVQAGSRKSNKKKLIFLHKKKYIIQIFSWALWTQPGPNLGIYAINWY